jgi:hypothetical protein
MAFSTETSFQSTEEGLDTGISLKSGTDYYINDVLRGIARYEQSLQNMQGVTDIRPRLLGRAVILKILDDEIREELLDKLDCEIDRITNQEGANNDQKAHEILIAIQNSHGQVYSFLDQFLGISKHLMLGKI